MKRRTQPFRQEQKEASVLSNLAFFMSVFVALILIGACSLLARTTLGKTSAAFAFLILFLSTLLKWSRKW